MGVGCLGVGGEEFFPVDGDQEPALLALLAWWSSVLLFVPWLGAYELTNDSLFSASWHLFMHVKVLIQYGIVFVIVHRFFGISLVFFWIFFFYWMIIDMFFQFFFCCNRVFSGFFGRA